MIGCLAAGRGTGVFLAQHRKAAPREPELAVAKPHVVDHSEPIAPELARLGWAGSVARRRPPEAVGAAAGGAVLDRQVAAGNMKHRIGVEVAVCVPEVAEGDLLGVSQQPGGLVIE